MKLRFSYETNENISKESDVTDSTFTLLNRTSSQLHYIYIHILKWVLCITSYTSLAGDAE